MFMTFYFEETWKRRGFTALFKVNFSLVEKIFFPFVNKGLQQCIATLHIQ